MRGVTPCLVVAAAAAWCVAGKLPPADKGYRMLLLLPICSRSHRNVFMALAEALADRGHKVDMLSPYPPSSTHPNIREVSHELPHLDVTSLNMFEARKQGPGGLGFFKEVLPQMARDMYKVPAVKELYGRRMEYDLIVVDHIFNEVAYPFVHNRTFITLATPGMDPCQSAVLGNVLSPSYTPNLLVSYPFPMTLWQRLKNTVMHVFIAVFWRNWAVVPLIQKEISAQFPDLPPLLEIERNQSLALLNTHFSITAALPLLPSQVEVGAMHCRPARPLPQDLEAWISGAGSEGVIYFSLGSVTRGETMPQEYRKTFIEAFRRLPQRVLWKYEDELEDLPGNVKLSKWLPQQDVLAHENVRVFISHGGLLSLQESIYHATPLLVLPIFGDQPRNGMFVEDSGLGRVLVWEELTPESTVEALTDIITNTKYQGRVSAMSSSLRDQPSLPQERAVFWTEYVIRHRGAPQLRCPAAQLSWVEFLLLDVLGVLLLAMLLLLFLLRRLLRVVCHVFRGSGGKRKTE